MRAVGWSKSRDLRPKRWSAAARLIVLGASLVLVGLPVASTSVALAAGPWSITQITDNGVNDEVPQVSGNRIVWRAYDGHDHEIMLYDQANGAITQLTDNASEDWEPHIDGGTVVWLAGGAGDTPYELMLRDLDAGAARRLGSGLSFGTYDIRDGLVAWSSYDWTSPGGSATLSVQHMADGVTREVPLEKSYRAIWPTTDGRYVLYTGDIEDLSSEVMLYDTVRGTTIRLSDPGAGAMERGPDGRALAEGRAVWSASDGHDREVYLYDTATGTTEQLTDNDVDDVEPQVGGNRVLWHELSAPQQPGPPSPDRTIVLYDGATEISTILGTGFGILQEDGRVAAWTAWPQRFEELFVRDVDQGETTTIEESGYDGSWPDLRDSRVVWYRQMTNARTNTMEVMLATRDSTPTVPTAPTPPYVVFADAIGPYAEAVRQMGREGIVRGYVVGDHLEFHPEYTLLRSQFALMLSGAADLSLLEPTPAPPFTDLGGDVSDLVRQAVGGLYAAGLMRGTDVTRFAPWERVSRAQVVTAVVRAAQAGLPGGLPTPPEGFLGTLGSFSSAHAQSMRLAEYSGLLQGLQGFGPGWNAWAPATRGEAAQLLWNLMRAK